MPEPSEHASAAATEPTRLDASRDSHLESLYRAAIGPMQADYYLPILMRFEAYGRAGPRWNWAACLVTLNWMVLRGLWSPALGYLAAVAAAALALAAGLALAEPTPAESVQWGLWAALVTLALLVPGFFGNAWLYRVYRQRLDKALARTANLKEACTLLARQSSSQQRLTAIAVANVVLAIGMAIAFWPAQLQMRMWPRVSGDVVTIAAPAAAPPAAQGVPGQVPAPATDAPAATATPDLAASAAQTVQPASATRTAPPLADGSAPASAGDAAAADASPAASATADRATTPAAAAATESVLESSSTAATPAPATPAATEPQALGPLAQAAAQQQAAIAAHARKARLPPTSASASASASTAAETATTPTPAAGPAPGGRYLINVGLFAQLDNAVRAHTRLKVAGLPATSESLQTRNGQRTRVRVGPFATRAQADAAAERIRSLQLDAVVIRQ